jgi:hypothetical protein
MLIKIIYILFIAASDFLLYSMLNKTGKVSTTVQWSFWTTFLIVVLLHTGLFKLDFLMPLGHFLMVIQFLIELIIFHFVGKYYIYRTQNSTRLSVEVASFSIKIASFIFLKAIYILIFIVQCVFILVDMYSPPPG